MNLPKIALTAPLVAIIVLLSSFSVSAANWFVSETGTWKPEGKEGTLCNSLSNAVAQAVDKDVIWLEDGFIDEPKDASDHSADKQGVYVRIKVTKDITIRSVSGDAVTSANPPRLRGRWHSPETGVKVGTNAIRPLWATAGRFEGLVFENGASVTGNYSSNGGGAVYGSGGTFVKCVFRNNYAGTGGAIKGRTTCYGCVFTNNYAVGNKGAGGAINCTTGCDLYDCYFADNSSTDSGAGAIRIISGTGTPCVISNCTFVGNQGKDQASNAPMGGAIRCETSATYRPTLYDCAFTNNVSARFGGAYYGAGVFHRCTFHGNYLDTTSYGCGGAVAGGDEDATDRTRAVLYDCHVISNKSSNAGNTSLGGGGIYVATAIHTVFIGNRSRNNGGAAVKSALIDCEVVRNRKDNNSNSGAGLSACVATNCLIAGNVIPGDKGRNYYGAGAHNCDLVNCTVVSNSCPGYGAGYGGAGLSYTEPGHFCYNTLIADNVDTVTGTGAIIASSADNAPTLVNCTVSGNGTNGNARAVHNVILVNSIVYGNARGTQDDVIRAATNSCASILTDTTKYPGCVTEDPRFETGAYTLSFRSPCRDAGLPFKWMTDKDDPRSKDLLGNPRLASSAPDMGCYERPYYGLMLLLR